MIYSNFLNTLTENKKNICFCISYKLEIQIYV